MNRKSLITFFTLFCCQVLFSQTEFAPVGAEWYYKMHAPIGPMFGYDHFTVVKDTQFLETECRKVRVERVNSEDNKYDEFNFFIYDDNGKVFISYHDNFELLYDFNLNTGDTLKSIIPFEYIFENTPDIVYLNQEADSVETIEISEFLAKKIYLNTTNNIYNFYHITKFQILHLNGYPIAVLKYILRMTSYGIEYRV